MNYIWGGVCAQGPVHREPVRAPFPLWLRVRQSSKGFRDLLTHSILTRERVKFKAADSGLGRRIPKGL